MGIFDIFKKADKPKGKSNREFSRLARVVGEKLAQDYDRQEAIRELSDLKTAEAARALLRRFDFTMEPSVTDQEEKAAAAEGVVAAAGAALIPLRDYCVRAESLSWPLKILARVVPEERLEEEILGILDQFDTEYVRNPEPKIQLITFLESKKSDDVREAVEPFLEDVSEPVRFHAVNTVFAQANTASAGALVAALAEEESLRVKNRIAGGLAAAQWTIPANLRELCSQSLPESYRLQDDGRVLAS